MFSPRARPEPPPRARARPKPPPEPDPPAPDPEPTEDLTPRQLIDGAIELFLQGKANFDEHKQEIVNMRDGALPIEWAVARFAAINRALWLGELSARWPLLLGREFVTTWLRDPRMARICGLKRPLTAKWADRNIGFVLNTLVEWGVLVRLPEKVQVNGGRAMWAYELGSGDRATEVAGASAHQPDDRLHDDDLVDGAEVQIPLGPLDAAVGMADVESGGSHAWE